MSERLMKLIAPFRCQFTVDYAGGLEERHSVNEYLKALSKELDKPNTNFSPDIPQGVSVKVLVHPDDPDVELRYISLNEANSYFDAHQYFLLSLNECACDILELLKNAAQAADASCKKGLSEKLNPKSESVGIIIYDNTIAILSMELIIEDAFLDEDWVLLDEWTTRFVYSFLNTIYRDFIYLTIKGINRYAEHYPKAHIGNPDHYHIFYDMSASQLDAMQLRLLWVNRTLICSKEASSGDWPCCRLNKAQAISINGACVYAGWGNNVIEITHANRSHDFSCIWQGILLAQYYYAVLEIFGKNLKRFIGLNYIDNNNKELRALSEAINKAINAIILFHIEYKDVSRELQGLPRTIFRSLEKEWDFDLLVEEVMDKRDLCQSQALQLDAYMNKRNSGRIELVLAGVFSISFVGLMLSISSYGRTLFQEGYTHDIVGLLDMATYVSPNTMIWIGVVLAIVTTLFVDFHRTK